MRFLVPFVLLIQLLFGSFIRPLSADSSIVHVVRPGDTLASIAERYYGDPQRENVLVAENSLTSEGGSSIVVGLRLTIPTVSYHRVQQGESWVDLAKKYYGDAKRTFILFEANNGIPGTHPDEGAELLIPYPLRHIVGQSETLRQIAKIYYRDKDSDSRNVRTIRRFNQLQRIRVQRGQILLVPLSDLVLSEKGKEIAKQKEGNQKIGGEVRARQVHIQSVLPQLHQNVLQGRYAEVVSMGSRLLGEGDLTGNQIVTIQRELSIAYVALGRSDLAVESFKLALQRQPDLELDTVRTSPKVLTSLEQAKLELRKQKKIQEIKSKAGRKTRSRIKTKKNPKKD